nr:MAG TPA: hypothetical protein [Caudoviricetes sp.]
MQPFTFKCKWLQADYFNKRGCYNFEHKNGRNYGKIIGT